MTDTTSTAAAVQTAKGDLGAAKTRLRELTEERNRIDQDLRDAHATIARQKSEAARAGDPIASPAELDAVQLRERREELPYELHAQEMYVFNCELALLNVQDADRQARHEAAEAVFAEVKPRFEAVKDEYQKARAARIDSTRGSHAFSMRDLYIQTLEGLDANPPAVGEDYSPGAMYNRVVSRNRY